MKTYFFIAAAWLTECGISTAVEGISPDWTQVAAADLSLMGDYQGEWVDAPKGHYFEINKPLAAQVINVRAGEYRVQFFQEHDRRADPYLETAGKLDGEVIRFEDKGWKGTVSKDGLSGKSGPGHGSAGGVNFQLKRVVRSSPTLGHSGQSRLTSTRIFEGPGISRWNQAKFMTFSKVPCGRACAGRIEWLEVVCMFTA